MDTPLLLIIVAYAGIAQGANWIVEQGRGGGIALRWALMQTAAAVGFIAVVWYVLGEVPVLLALFLAAVALLALFRARFCARCGAYRYRRSPWDTDFECHECRCMEYVGLWRALDIPRATP